MGLQAPGPEEPTVKVAGVLLRFQVRDELGLLSQQTVPVQLCEERVLLHLKRSAWWHTQRSRSASFKTQQAFQHRGSINSGRDRYFVYLVGGDQNRARGERILHLLLFFIYSELFQIFSLAGFLSRLIINVCANQNKVFQNKNLRLVVVRLRLPVLCISVTFDLIF